MKRPPLIDRHGRVHDYLRISVTDRCNLRCRYCMPPEGIAWQPRERILTYEEFARLGRLFVEMGVTKIRLTGGEPLVRRDIEELIVALGQLSGVQAIGLTTNGVTLAPRLEALQSAGVTHLNISLDTLRRDRFETLTLRQDFDAVVAALDAALAQGFERVKLNVVVMGDVNDDELIDFVKMTAGRPLGVRFIEYMPFAGNGWTAASVVSYATMRRTIEEHYTLVPVATHPTDVAREFRVPGFAGTVGFISSMTDDFCGTCSRVRITADGHIRPCLHDNAETPLLVLLRSGGSDDDIVSAIRSAVYDKVEKHAPGEQLVQLGNRSMIQIGG